MLPPDTLLKNADTLINHILSVLHDDSQHHRIDPKEVTQTANASAVLFALGLLCEDNRVSSEPCLILNKRSSMVRQPGDLCCPGGSISSRMDGFLSRMLYLPGSPLSRWPHWREWLRKRNREARALATCFATALRESYEEMRLNPLGVKFLGPLPSQQLAMFRRRIYPMACWISQRQKFSLNWEVERLIYLPLRNLLDPSRYARCRLWSEAPRETWNNERVRDFPCFINDYRTQSEILWGVTFRISMAFLDLAFGFQPPNLESLPVVHGTLDRRYSTGSR
jgi:hypothetical protein